MSESANTVANEQDPVARAAQVVEATLADLGVEWEPGAADNEFVVTLPGERKLKTVVSLLLQRERGMSLSAFVIRNADENHEEFYRFLLRRNLRLPGLAYAIDSSGDVYLVGQVPLAAIDAAYLDQLFGVVLNACDAPFNELLLLGFESSMRKEWAWRISRGESTRNLEAFRHVLEQPASGDETTGEGPTDRG